MFIRLILIIIFALASGFTYAGSSCQKILKNLNQGWSYDKAEVPLNWNNPDGKRIEVYFYYRDRNFVPGNVPVVFLNGGPTLSGVSAHKTFDKIDLFNDLNLILIDQRGTGCSGNFPAYPENDIQDFTLFASDSIVQDAEAIRKKIKSPSWKIYGQSYGGLISFRYLEMYPESLHSAHIHGFGTVSEDQNFVDLREKKILEITPLILQFRDKSVSKYSIGETVQRIQELSTLNENRFNRICVSVPDAQEKQLCGDDLFTGLFMITGFKSYWGLTLDYLDALVNGMEKNKWEYVEKTFRKFIENFLLRFSESNQVAALHAISYYEMLNGSLFYEGCQDQKENELISECRFHRNFLGRLTVRPEFKTRPLDLKRIKRNIEINKVPVYYYGGLFDTFIPIEVIRNTAKELGIKSSLIEFSHSGHEGYITEKLVLKNLIKD